MLFIFERAACICRNLCKTNEQRKELRLLYLDEDEVFEFSSILNAEEVGVLVS